MIELINLTQSSKNDPLGDRMKLYEQTEAGRKLMPLLPAMARIDGRGFSRFTKGMKRPYDKDMSNFMHDTTRYLVQETGAVCGYTQSDEISLCWIQPHFGSEIFFGGKIQKMVSQLAALATMQFNQLLINHPSLFNKKPTFDARVWNVPSLAEAVNTFLWRELDASKNSISMAARHYYSHLELHGKTWGEMNEMLFQKGINWNDYPVFFKRGTFFRKVKETRPFTTEEIEKLPEKHAARTDPNLTVERTTIVDYEIPPLLRIQNKTDVLFKGAEVILFQEIE